MARRCQSAANNPCGVHLSIVSPLVNDVRHIAVLFLLGAFQTTGHSPQALRVVDRRAVMRPSAPSSISVNPETQAHRYTFDEHVRR
jgi:hypothetical protein